MEMEMKQNPIGAAGRSRSAGLVTATRVDWWRELPNYAVVNQPSPRRSRASSDHRHQRQPGRDRDRDQEEHDEDDHYHDSEVLWETRDEAAVPTHDGGGLAWDADVDDDGGGHGAVWASARSLSTYPLLPTGQRDGDPNADCAWVRLYANRAFVALADGCNWGHRPRDAARSAVAALRDYLTRRCGRDAVVPDLHEAAHYLLRAFAEADRRIMQGKGDTWEAGTTTLIGGLLLQLAPPPRSSTNAGDDDDEEGEESSRQLRGQWGFVCCSVGDCKAFHYAPARGGGKGGGEVTDITAGNRMNVTDVRDPGGRLGPYLEGGAPDLRNLKLYFMPCEPGDVLLLVSDGVHDNFDPQMLGRLPSEVGLELKDDAWESDAPTGLGGSESVEVEVAKDKFRAAALQQLLEAGPLTPRAITTRLVDHCYATTRVCREFMEHSPQARQPTDYRQFPGKMDHTTAACLIVPSIAAAAASSSSSSSSS